MGRFCEVKVRMITDRRSLVQQHAANMQENTTAFINRAIDEIMEWDMGTSITTPAATVVLSSPDMPEEVQAVNLRGMEKTAYEHRVFKTSGKGYKWHGQPHKATHENGD